MRTVVSATLTATLALALMAASCASSQPRTEPATVRPASRHAVHSDRLRAVMNGLDKRARKTWPQEIAEERRTAEERDREVRLQEARDLAAALADAAGQIPSAIEGVELTDAERAAFMAGVGRLRTQARELEVSVAARDVNRMHAILRSIRVTCNNCHGQFRELAGSVDSGQLQLVSR